MTFEEYREALAAALEEGRKKGENPFDRESAAGKLMTAAAGEAREVVSLEQFIRLDEMRRKQKPW